MVVEKMIVRIVNAIGFEMARVWSILANARSADPSALVSLLDVIAKLPGPAPRLSGSLRESPAREMPPQRALVVFVARGRGRPPGDRGQGPGRTRRQAGRQAWRQFGCRSEAAVGNFDARFRRGHSQKICSSMSNIANKMEGRPITGG